MKKIKGALALGMAGSLMLGPAVQVEANPALAPAAVACVASAACIVGVVVFAGVTYWVLSTNGQEVRVPVFYYTPDPEEPTEDWEDYVWAENEQQAQRKCQMLAEGYTYQGGSPVIVVGVRRTSRRGSRWACTFRG